jgi:hypothetical protein
MGVEGPLGYSSGPPIRVQAPPPAPRFCLGSHLPLSKALVPSGSPCNYADASSLMSL